MVKIKEFSLEEHVEGKKKSQEEKEEDEKEELAELMDEGDSYTSSRINHFLANPYKEVSLEKNDFVIKDLEEDLPVIKKEENEDEEDNLSYLIKNEFEKGIYNPGIKVEGHFVDINQNDKSKIFSEQKRMYNELRNMSQENEEIKGPGLDAQIRYTKIEDVQKKENLSSKKFY